MSSIVIELYSVFIVVQGGGPEGGCCLLLFVLGISPWNLMRDLHLGFESLDKNMAWWKEAYGYCSWCLLMMICIWFCRAMNKSSGFLGNLSKGPVFYASNYSKSFSHSLVGAYWETVKTYFFYLLEQANVPFCHNIIHGLNQQNLLMYWCANCKCVKYERWWKSIILLTFQPCLLICLFYASKSNQLLMKRVHWYG